MTEPLLWALFDDPEKKIGQAILMVLAVAGGALIGGLGAGLLVQLAVKLLYGGKVPNAVLQIVRIVGAVIGGWVVYLIFFGGLGGAGPGPGGPGGTGKEGAGPGPAASSREGPSAAETRREEGPPPTPENTVRVEVLGEGFSGDRFYRVAGEPQTQTLEQIKQAVDQKRQQAPGLQKLEIVLYENSPHRDTPVVMELQNWAKQKGLTPIVALPPGKAP